ncbi:MAG TPA: hypothetical protein VLA91_16645 [Acidimicrobiia bacterium]|nr:hypothetical protein [Acidimicrobiia bacterium]
METFRRHGVSLGRNALPILALRMMMRTEVAKKNMHEQELMAEVVETLQSLADGESVGEVEIALGPGVGREDAKRAWEALTEDTPLAGAHASGSRLWIFCNAGTAVTSTPGTASNPVPHAEGTVW